MIQLFDRCVYTIIPRDAFANALATDHLRYTENKRWAGALRWLEEARTTSRRLPLVLADASRCRDLIGWALIEDITLKDSTSTVVARPVVRLHGRHQQQLTVESTGHAIAKNHQRPYVLCRTPRFLDVRSMTVSVVGIPPSHEHVLAEQQEYVEGAPTKRMVVHRRREAQLREHKLKQFQEQNNGRLQCEVLAVASTSKRDTATSVVATRTFTISAP